MTSRESTIKPFDSQMKNFSTDKSYQKNSTVAGIGVPGGGKYNIC